MAATRAKSAPHRSKTKAQSLIVFALALVAVLAFIGLALDGGLAFSKRRLMQNAADAGALAGARELTVIGEQSAIYDRINEYSVQRNGAITFSARYQPSNAPVLQSPGQPPENSDGVCVTSNATYEPLFVQLVGVGDLAVSAEACAAAESRCPSPGYAIWANAPYDPSYCQRAMDWSGSNNLVTGNVHSNGTINLGGSNNRVVGGIEHVSGIQNGGSGNVYTPTTTTITPMPLMYDIDDYEPAWYDPSCNCWRPAGRAAQEAAAAGKYYSIVGDYTFTDSSPEGLYYVTGKAVMGLSNYTRTITVVSENLIDISGSNHNINPYIDGLLFFSNWNRVSEGLDKPCNDPVIKMAGSNHSWNGVIFAPWGLVELSGSSNSSITGSVIGHAVRLNGSGMNISYSDQYCPTVGRETTSRLRRP